ncbi:MAG: hypothetical protein K8S25_04880 [Alphaproteobacteria bacterium]|nr:hypothetical protein [Alphaproteobacteria bacterium]
MTEASVGEKGRTTLDIMRRATLRRGGPIVLAMAAASFVLCAGLAQADNLQAPPGAPAWLHFAADALLFLHIGGGTVGMLSGTVALLSRKGERLHRAAGTVFFGAMLITYAIGAGVAPFLDDGQRPNTVAGVMALYLLISGWMTVRRPENTSGRLEVIGLGVALLVAAAGALFMYMGANSATGTIDGSPPQAFFVFALAGTFAAAGELNVILRRGIAGAARVARHLWRMCFSLFIASGSFFLGQQQVMPEWMRDSPLLFVAALAPLGFLFFWMIRVRLTGWYKNASAAPDEFASAAAPPG